MRRNVSGQFVGCQLISKTDGSAVTTGTTTVYVTGDAGTQAAGSVGSGACTHEGNGYWTYAPAQAETNYTQVAFTFVNTSACNVTVQIYPISYDASGQMTGVTVGTNSDKTGYSLTQSFPTNFSSLAITVGGAVTAGTVSDKTGYSLTQSFPTNFSSMAITAGGAVTAGTVSDKTGYSLANGSISSLTFSAGAIDAAALAADCITSSELAATAAEEIADTILGRNVAGGANGGRMVKEALYANRNKVEVSAGTLTVYGTDDITPAFTATVVTTAGNPISSIDPA